MPLLNSFCAFDTETTGLVPKSRRHRAFEFSAVRFSRVGSVLQPVGRLTRFIEVDPSQLKGLTLSEQWKEHQLLKVKRYSSREVVGVFQEFFGNSAIVCHNVKFDQAVLLNEIDKSGSHWKPSNDWLCSLELAREAGIGKYVGYERGRPDGMSYRLEDVAEAFGMKLQRERLHHGDYDAEIAGEVYHRLQIRRSAKQKPIPVEPTKSPAASTTFISNSSTAPAPGIALPPSEMRKTEQNSSATVPVWAWVAFGLFLLFLFGSIAG